VIAAVIGLGSIGLRHARNLVDLKIDVIGYDPDAAACDKAATFGAIPASSREAAIERADVVVVASPNRFHLDDLKHAIANKRPVYVEKPIGHDSDQLAKLLNQADSSGLTVFAGLNLRYHPCIEQVSDLLKSGDIGEILWARFIAASYLPSWRAAQDHRTGYAADPVTGGILFDDIHEIDLANHLLGKARVVAATARCTGSIGISSDDCADLILQHEGGCHSAIHMDYVTRTGRRTAEIAGTSGFIKVDITGRRFWTTDKNGFEKCVDPGGEVNDDYRNAMAHFLSCALGQNRPRCDGREALEILRQTLDARAFAGLPH
jgi:predicted dehydrogenase